MLKNLMKISLFSLMAQASFAQVVCDAAATPTNPTQLSCGAERISSYVAPTQKVSRVIVLVSDSTRGLERRVEIHKVNQPVSKLDNQNIAANAMVKAEVAKIQKEWNTKSARIEVVSYEFDQKAQFFTATDKKTAIPVAKFMRPQARTTASTNQPALAGGVRK